MFFLMPAFILMAWMGEKIGAAAGVTIDSCLELGEKRWFVGMRQGFMRMIFFVVKEGATKRKKK